MLYGVILRSVNREKDKIEKDGGRAMLKSNGKRVVRQLKPEEVTRYALVSSEATKLDKEKKVLRDDLVLKLRGKHPDYPRVRFVSPDECPFTLALTYQKRSEMDWETLAYNLFLTLLVAFKGDESKATTYMNQVLSSETSAELAAKTDDFLAITKEEAGYKRVPTLLPPKPNVKFIAKQNARQSAA
jgi:hypothetical protein